MKHSLGNQHLFIHNKCGGKDWHTYLFQSVGNLLPVLTCYAVTDCSVHKQTYLCTCQPSALHFPHPTPLYVLDATNLLPWSPPGAPLEQIPQSNQKLLTHASPTVHVVKTIQNVDRSCQGTFNTEMSYERSFLFLIEENILNTFSLHKTIHGLLIYTQSIFESRHIYSYLWTWNFKTIQNNKNGSPKQVTIATYIEVSQQLQYSWIGEISENIAIDF